MCRRPAPAPRTGLAAPRMPPPAPELRTTSALPVGALVVQFVPFEVHLVTRTCLVGRPALFSGRAAPLPHLTGAAAASGCLLPIPPDASREGPGAKAAASGCLLPIPPDASREGPGAKAGPRFSSRACCEQRSWMPQGYCRELLRRKLTHNTVRSAQNVEFLLSGDIQECLSPMVSPERPLASNARCRGSKALLCFSTTTSLCRLAPTSGTLPPVYGPDASG